MQQQVSAPVDWVRHRVFIRRRSISRSFRQFEKEKQQQASPQGQEHSPVQTGRLRKDWIYNEPRTASSSCGTCWQKDTSYKDTVEFSSIKLQFTGLEADVLRINIFKHGHMITEALYSIRGHNLDGRSFKREVWTISKKGLKQRFFYPVTELLFSVALTF